MCGREAEVASLRRENTRLMAELGRTRAELGRGGDAVGFVASKMPPLLRPEVSGELWKRSEAKRTWKVSPFEL